MAVMLADYDGPAIQLGTGGISGPTEEEEEGKGSYYIPNSYIYFGVNSGNSSTPIKWRYWMRTRPTMEQQAECSCCRSICWRLTYNLTVTIARVMPIKAATHRLGAAAL